LKTKQITGTLIADSDERQIGELITWICHTVGIKHIPDAKLARTLVDFFYDEYNDVKVNFIKSAFIAYIKNQLDEPHEHYQALSSLYINRIVQSYRRHVMSRQPDCPIVVKEPSNEEKDRMIYDNILFCFQNYIDSGNNQEIRDSGGVVHKILVRMGLINWTDKEQSQLIKDAENAVKMNLEFGLDSGTISDIIKARRMLREFNAKDNRELIGQHYRRLSLMKYFEQLRNEGKTIKDVL